MDQTTLIGTTGATIILIAFILNQIHVWKDDYLAYDVFNFVGSVLLVTYALILDSWPFLILNSVWAIISLRDAIFDLRRDIKKSQK